MATFNYYIIFREVSPSCSIAGTVKGSLLECWGIYSDGSRMRISWPTINIRPHIMHFRRLAFSSYTEVIY